MIAPTGRQENIFQIVIALASSSNKELLEQLLGRSFQLSYGLTGRAEQLAEKADLLIVDVVSLQRHYHLIRELRRSARPMILPVLLVIESRQGPHPKVASELGISVDDILRIPTSKAELQARIKNLLRLRTLVKEQDDARKKVVGVVSALRTLSACDSVVVRSESESELTSALCQKITEQGGYNLAWIGFWEDQSHLALNICAMAGPSQGFVADLKQSMNQQSNCTEAVADSIRTNTTHIVNDLNETIVSPELRARALQHDLAAAIVLPLNTESGPSGCLTIYSDRIEYFDHSERQLLERLADNLVFGLNSLRAAIVRKQQASEIQYLAYTDSLTGLPNRRHLIDYLERTLSDPEKRETVGAILFVDLDGFKLINDALGHDAGDEVLRQLAQRLQAAVRDSDLVVRQGGDEFIVVIHNVPRSGTQDNVAVGDVAFHLADRIITHLSEPLTIGAHTHSLNASVGISLFPEHGREPTLLIENADKAMYEAKRQGSGCVRLFSEDFSTRRQHRFSLEAKLRHALAQEQFELYYQPIFELDSCRIVAAEALIRWPQPNGEIVMPGSFMSLVEEIGLIIPLGNWILETAARQLQAWHKQGFELSMTVNLSINQLYPNGNASLFADLVKPYVDPSWLHLEVTEHALMGDPVEIELLLRALRDEGFQLAIDDFGTGYSSLSRLQQLSIQTLKIDRSFVSQLCQPESKSEALIAIIHQMAKSLNLRTIAEGIETEQQRQLLLATSSDNAWGQGFLLSPAVPADEFSRLLDS
ncbi:EAL domain-containing protein [Pseudidiomarina sp. 1APP75-32.1]|uniref:EAL domain-containing protein n=1 Tax=Pseudidiomarina terrestris TaxID=2820060 RepID=A0AAW7QXG8_9GAMM|nr:MULTISPECIES: EAL domain-containing protein [unclassified Pseudidiomarina]MDN7124856.1 EAL domain-containing protein [Pseudidiomarina sp. 1APP75-32.1]MDN7129670.1 EAL domain-containing protein [Pseudidiomarina sp. 1APR75-15]